MRVKIMLCCFILLGCVQQASAQALIALVFGGKMKNDKIKLGIYLGASGSWITEAEGKQVQPGLVLGAYTAYILHPKWELCLYLIMKSPKGARQIRYNQLLSAPGDSTLTGADINRSFTYMNASPLIRYKLSESWGIAAGPQLAARVRAKDTYTKDVGEGTSSFTFNAKKYIKLVDVGLAFDLQYTLMKGKGIRLDLQYNMGLMNIYNDRSALSGKNVQLVFGVGIPIGK